MTFLLLFILPLLLFIYSQWERNQLRVEKYSISTDKVKKAYRFLFLTDLHDKSFGKDNELLLKKIEALKPRWIFIGGDFPISYSGEETAERDEVENSCRLLYALAEKYPLYYAFGNHEEKLFSKEDFQGKQQAFRKGGAFAKSFSAFRGGFRTLRLVLGFILLSSLALEGEKAFRGGGSKKLGKGYRA